MQYKEFTDLYSCLFVLMQCLGSIVHLTCELVNVSLQTSAYCFTTHFLLQRDSKIYHPAAIKILDIKVPMPGTVKET